MIKNNNILVNIQFLRGISVLLVFFYHLKLKYFEYGFLGVDIFFVISGFVITSSIYNEFELTKKFNFFNFYLKRLKRIYPVLIFILSIIFLFIIFFQPINLFMINFKVFFFSLFGVSNFYYLYSKKDYFDHVYNDPFGHTWSLGVEEQFYIIFPLFFFILLKYIKEFKNIFFVLFVAIISGIIATLFFQNDSELVFYSPFFRFWEFLIGSLIFFISIKTKYRNNIISSLTLIILILFILIPKSYYSSLNILLLTTLLTSLFILSYKKNTKKMINSIVENRLIIFIGNISYSFYLWHLPIIYFYDLYYLDSLFRIPFLFFLTLLLSYISYIAVENKFRYTQIKFKTPFRNITLSIVFLLSIFLINYFAYQEGHNNKIKRWLKDLIYNVNYLENKINFSERTDFYKININNNKVYDFCTESSDYSEINSDSLRINCLKNEKNKNGILYIHGDSLTAHFIPMFNELNINEAIYYSHKTKPLSKIDFKHLNKLRKSYNEVTFVTNINNLNSLTKLIDIKDKFNPNIKILILGPTPRPSKNLDSIKCFIKNINCSYDTLEDEKQRNLFLLNSKIKLLADNNFNIFYFNAYKSICPKKICYVFNKEKNLITHIDGSHLSLEGSILMKKNFITFYNNKFKSN